MIASFIDGRVRIRANALKDPEFLARIREAVSSMDGILELKDNPRTGSLLVLYDPARISRDDLALAAGVLQEESAAVVKEEKACKPKRLYTRRQEAALLSAVYGLTVLAAFMDKRAHIAAGALFTPLAGKHLYDRRRCL